MTYPTLFEEYDPLKGEMFQILDPEGEVNEELEPSLEDEYLTRVYRTMVLARAADKRSVTLQRQGKMGAYPPTEGQEASQLGPTLALRGEDWLVQGYREMAAVVWKGVPLWRMFLFWMGNEEGTLYPDNVRVTPPVVPVGDQITHAVGISYASKLRGEDSVSMVYFGDGGSSEGAFHEGLNFAGVLKTPTIFVCQNNQYAISVPRKFQTASETIAQKAVAYGFPGIQVDGNDILALYVAAEKAVERARNGEGPTLIETYTYRLGDHTTSDDARRYRSEEEVEQWEDKDPLKRFRIYLENKGLWSEDEEEKIEEEVKNTIDEAVEKALSHPKPDIEDVFEYTYKEIPPYLNEQLKFLKKELDLEGEE
ncbi:pyruvate dehydrogenase (acetyl-transferring) E1 component subunit alpha [Candidatus Bathyarchaeota archaeon]|nr:pyruvate dehydrogenase (acetyl-transferring) E1 component subunit alpha [Candidatus Bathyarchaeota archaeon]